jgi:pre-mRNA-splicing factor ATP-dependent RNA helicase DHX15/PRP43
MLDGKQVPATYANMAKYWTRLPLYSYRDEIVKSIQDNHVSLITAGTGVGKTVIIPKLALHAYGYNSRIITTIPKRIITKSTAVRDAKWLDTKIGDQVGYYYKGAHVMSPATKLIFTTTGSLLSRLTGNDPQLSEYQVVIIDEAHERSVQTDQVLLLLKYALDMRPDLRVVIMSATIDVGIFKRFFVGHSFNHIDVPGISYPITHYWDNRGPVSNWYDAAINITMRILQTSDTGDILIFGKSGGDAGQICGALQRQIERHNKINPDWQQRPYCVKLASNSSADEERLATEQYAYLELKVDGLSYTRKVVVATNVAESSITVNGITYVIDSGLEYTEAYNPETMTRSLVEAPAPQSSITQRAGRAGRVAPGICFHLYSMANFKARDMYPIPNIQKTDITSDILDLMRIDTIKSEADLHRLLSQFISPPPTAFVQVALRTLRVIGAINSSITADAPGILTQHGHNIAKFRGLKPGMANSILIAGQLNCWRSVIRIVAGATILDGQMDLLFAEPSDKREMGTFKRTRGHLSQKSGDLSTLLHIMDLYHAKRREFNTVPEPIARTSILDELIDDSIENQDNTEGEQTGGAPLTLDKWCRANYLSTKRLRLIYQLEQELTRVFHNCKPAIALDPALTVLIKNKPDETRVLCALVLGNPHQLARRRNKQEYMAVFPSKPIPSRATESWNPPKTEYVLFYEQFINKTNAKQAKLNVVNEVPTEIAKLLKLGKHYMWITTN